MRKIAVAIAPKDALPEAFVVFRGFEESIPLAADLGYHGAELALKRASDLEGINLDKLLSRADIEVSAISTGQLYLENGLTLMCLDKSRREELFGIFHELIDLAAGYGRKVNIGRVRGKLIRGSEDKCIALFNEGITRICDYAAKKSVDILLEPVNRYESNFINNLAEAAEIIDFFKFPNLFIMPDLFHMNIESPVIENELVKYKDKINYIHFADSNRFAPGWGHTDFKSIQAILEKMDYTGWYTVEILPVPDPVSSAKQAVEVIKNL